MNWNDSAERARLAARLGPDAYNKAFAAHRAATVLATVNGYSLRHVQTRFGQLVAVDGANIAFRTLAEAEAHARGLPSRS